ncbi:hypothetical protein NBRC116493_35670 [Aurantivibrio infirmus]
MDKENLTIKDVMLIVGPLAAFIVGIILLGSGFRTLGLFIIVPIICLYIYAFFKIPWTVVAEREREKEEQLKEKRFGRARLAVKYLFNYLSIAIGIFVLLLFATYVSGFFK